MAALFISDLHIDESRPHILDGLRSLLATESRRVDAIYILGDLVEVWVGDDDDGPTATAIRAVLADAASRCPLFVMHGNRDFLFGERFAAETGASLIDDPAVIDVDGEAVLIAHGDAYCTRDEEYQQVRAQLRSEAWQAAVLAMDLTARRALAGSMRAKSIAVNENKADNIMDVTPAAVEATMAAAQVRLMVHGHTHRPGIHDLAEGRRRIVLGDWDRCGWKLTVNNGDAALTCFALAVEAR